MRGSNSAVDGPAVALPFDDIDTDVILPQTYMTTTSRTGLGRGLFANWRYLDGGLERADFALNQPADRRPGILVVGANYGCGSSREHAVWAHLDFGVQAVVAPSFAPIFEENAVLNGLLLARISAADWASLVAGLIDRPGARLQLDPARRTLRDGPGAGWTLDVSDRMLRSFRKGGALLDEILVHEAAIARYEARDREARPWVWREAATRTEPGA